MKSFLNIQTGNEKKKCHCGAKNCSSFLGVRPKNQIQDEKPKKAGDKRKKKKIKKPVVKEGMCAKSLQKEILKWDLTTLKTTAVTHVSYRNQDKTHSVIVQQRYGNQKQYFCNPGLARY